MTSFPVRDVVSIEGSSMTFDSTPFVSGIRSGLRPERVQRLRAFW